MILSGEKVAKRMLKYKPRACLAFGSLINKEIDGSMDRWMDL